MPATPKSERGETAKGERGSERDNAVEESMKAKNRGENERDFNLRKGKRLRNRQ
jgi:hypothetical protein